MRSPIVVLSLLLTLGLVLYGCDRPAPEKASEEASADKIGVMVSIVPQQYVVRQLGGDYVQVESITPPNYSPETYQVTPRQMDALGRAQVFCRIGMPYEETLVNRLSELFPSLIIVDTREGVSMLAMEEGGDHGHSEDSEEEHHHHHGDLDPHIWLDPLRVKIQAASMADALKKCRPDQAAYFDENLKAFEEEMDRLHEEASQILAPVKGKTFYVFHPAFGYFADSFGLEQRAIESEGKSPGPRRLYAIIEELKNTGARALFEQPQFKAVELNSVAAETGVSVVLLDGLAADYYENMIRMARALAEHLQDEPEL